MKVFCWHTETHQGLVEDFLRPTLPAGMELVLEVGRQDCPSAEFMKEGWRESMKARAAWWMKVVMMESDPLLFVDADVQFFQDPRADLDDRLREYELLGQYDVFTPICCGLMAIRPTPEVQRLFIDVYQKFEQFAHDQMALNAGLRNGIKWQSLPWTYWSVGQTNGAKVWEPGQAVEPPQNIIAHHGNFTVGLPDKVELMKETRRIVHAR